MRKTNGLSQLLGQRAAALSGKGPNSREFKLMLRRLEQLGLRRIPGRDDCVAFATIPGGGDFNPRDCTIQHLKLMADIQKGPNSLGGEGRCRRGGDGRRPETNQTSSGRHREVVVTRPVVVMGRSRG